MILELVEGISENGEVDPSNINNIGVWGDDLNVSFVDAWFLEAPGSWLLAPTLMMKMRHLVGPLKKSLFFA